MTVFSFINMYFLTLNTKNAESVNYGPPYKLIVFLLMMVEKG